jgi:hypothetical protein
VAEALDNLTFTDATPSSFLGDYINMKVSTTDNGVERILTYFTILAATTEKAGLMSAEDKAKVDSFLTGIRSMQFVDATSSSEQAIKLVEQLKWTVGGVQEVIDSITLLAATSSKAGLLSASDKAYIDALPTTLTNLSNSISGALALMQSLVGYYVCDTAAGTAAKTVDATGYSLTNGGCIRIKMNNANTANNVTLNINSTGAKALYYDGTQASSTNTWEAGEVLEVYYDGTQYQCASGGGGGRADKVEYDNTGSGLTATNVQGAIDELSGEMDNKMDSDGDSDVYGYVRIPQDLNIDIASKTYTNNGIKYNTNAVFRGPMQVNGVYLKLVNTAAADIYVYDISSGTTTLIKSIPTASIINGAYAFYEFDNIVTLGENQTIGVSARMYYIEPSSYVGAAIVNGTTFPNALFCIFPSAYVLISQRNIFDDIDNLAEEVAAIPVYKNIPCVAPDGIDITSMTLYPYHSGYKYYNGHSGNGGINVNGVFVKCSNEYDLSLYILDISNNNATLLKTVPAADIVNGQLMKVMFDQPVSLGENQRIAAEGRMYYGTSAFGPAKHTNNGTYADVAWWLIPITYTVDGYVNDSQTEEVTNITRYAFDCNEERIGSLDLEGLPMDGYAHIILYGQSLSTGDAAGASVSGIYDSGVADTYCIGSYATAVSGAISPMRSGDGRESPIANAMFAFKRILNRTPYKNVKLIGSACGKGATTIDELSKGASTGYYENRFLSVINAAKAGAGAAGITCPAIVWMQGEYDQRTSDTTTVNGYKEKLLTLKNNMQSDIMTTYGQASKPLFFVYQTSILFTPKYPVVTEALREFAEEHDDVILMNPHYFCTTGSGGHLTANGYRWYGEYIAKSLYESLVHGNRYSSVTLRSVERIDSFRFIVNLNVVHPPLLFDTNEIEVADGYGFAIWADGVMKSVVASIYSPTQIMIECPLIGNPSVIEVEYGGQATNGAGNVRDNANYKAGSIMIDLSSHYSSTSPYNTFAAKDLAKKGDDGLTLVGRQFPMYNWLNNFRITLP